MSKDRIIQLLLVLVIAVLIIGQYTGNKATEPEDATEVSETEEAEATVEDEATPEGATTTPVSSAPAASPESTYKGSTCFPKISGEKSTQYNGILLNWSTCENLNDFQFYKLVRSSQNTNPTYPGDYVAFSSSNKNAANYIDKTVTRATTYYYRICAVQRVNKVSCGNVISVSY